jgi:hypothetical protein
MRLTWFIENRGTSLAQDRLLCKVAEEAVDVFEAGGVAEDVDDLEDEWSRSGDDLRR